MPPDLSQCFSLVAAVGVLGLFHYMAYRFLVHSDEVAIGGSHRGDYWQWLRRGAPGRFEPEGDTVQNKFVVQVMGVLMAVFMACVDFSLCANLVAPFVWRALGIK